MNTNKDDTMKPEETEQLNIRVPRSLHRALRIRAAQDDATIQSVAAAALHAYLMQERKAS